MHSPCLSVGGRGRRHRPDHHVPDHNDRPVSSGQSQNDAGRMIKLPEAEGEWRRPAQSRLRSLNGGPKHPYISKNKHSTFDIFKDSRWPRVLSYAPDSGEDESDRSTGSWSAANARCFFSLQTILGPPSAPADTSSCIAEEPISFFEKRLS